MGKSLEALFHSFIMQKAEYFLLTCLIFRFWDLQRNPIKIFKNSLKDTYVHISNSLYKTLLDFLVHFFFQHIALSNELSLTLVCTQGDFIRLYIDLIESLPGSLLSLPMRIDDKCFKLVFWNISYKFIISG